MPSPSRPRRRLPSHCLNPGSARTATKRELFGDLQPGVGLVPGERAVIRPAGPAGIFLQEGFPTDCVLVALPLQIRAEVGQIEGAVTLSGLIEVDDTDAVVNKNVSGVKVLVNRHVRGSWRRRAERGPLRSQPLSGFEHLRAVSADHRRPCVCARHLPHLVEASRQLQVRHVQCGQPSGSVAYAVKRCRVLHEFAQRNPGARSVQHEVLLRKEGQQLRYAEPPDSERATGECLQMRRTAAGRGGAR